MREERARRELAGRRWRRKERERWAAVAEWLEGKDEGKRGGAVEREEGYA